VNDIVEASPAICHRCQKEAYVRIDMPDRTTWTGRRVISLCPRCDRESPAASPLLAWLDSGGPVEPAELAALVRDWLADVCPPEMLEEAQAAIMAAWTGSERDGNTPPGQLTLDL
jgi:hypothetical protein